VVGTLAAALAAWLLRIWDASLSVPLYQQPPDTLFQTAVVKAIRDHGWDLTNPDLGAPFGTQMYDFPHAGETLQMAAIWVLTRFTSRPGAVINIYFIGGFGVLASVTHLVLRHLRFRTSVAACTALLYTFLPYHFWHQEGHLLRSTYVSGPLGALLILWVLDWRRRFLVEPDAPWRDGTRFADKLRWGRVGATVAVAAALGIIETMAIAFVLVALGVGAVLVTLRDRDPGVLAAAGVAGAVTALTFVIALAPNLWYWSEHGTNETAGRRLPVGQEAYGLKVSRLVLPIRQHRLARLASLTEDATRHTPVESEGGQELGVVGAVGFIVGLYGALNFASRRSRLHGARSPDRGTGLDRGELWRLSGVLTLVLVLFATVSGLSLLLSVAGFAQIRVWNRSVILIAFFSLLVVAIGLERFADWVGSRISDPRRAVAAGVLASVGVLLFGLWDTAVPFPTDYPAITRTARSDRGFVAELERRLPDGAAVFELPVVRYPESPPVHDLPDLTELRLYQYSRTLRWSYGGMKGRPQADWQQRVSSDDPVAALAGLRGLGFDGVVVFTQGYADGGAAVAARLSGALGPPEVASTDGHELFWDLRGYGANLPRPELREAARDLVGTQPRLP